MCVCVSSSITLCIFFLTEGTFPFPEQNVAALEHGGTCTSPDIVKSHPCSRAIDGKHETEAYRRRQDMTIVMNFNRVYVVNKVVFRSIAIVRNLTMTFADGTSEKVRPLNCNTTGTLTQYKNSVNG